VEGGINGVKEGASPCVNNFFKNANGGGRFVRVKSLIVF
jgi:hypothetical protein